MRAEPVLLLDEALGATAELDEALGGTAELDEALGATAELDEALGATAELDEALGGTAELAGLIKLGVTWESAATTVLRDVVVSDTLLGDNDEDACVILRPHVTG